MVSHATPPRGGSPAPDPHSAPAPPWPASAAPASGQPPVRQAYHLTAAGAVTMASTLTCVGVCVDLALSGGLGVWFSLLFLLGCGLAAARVRRRDVRTAVVMCPLVFLGALVVADLLSPSAGASWVVAQGEAVAGQLVQHAPTLYAGSAISAVVVALRRSRGQRLDRVTGHPYRAPRPARTPTAAVPDRR